MSEPITVEELKSHCRITTDSEDSYLSLCIAAAREQVELATSRTLVPKALTLRRHAFPCNGRIWFELPAPIARSITSIKYIDDDGVEQTWPSSEYRLDDEREPGLVVLMPGYDWPSTQSDRLNAVTVAYQAGFATPAVVPSKLKMAVLWFAALFYENRVPVNVGNIVNDLPHHLTAILAGSETYLIHLAEVASLAAASGANPVLSFPLITALEGGTSACLDSLPTTGFGSYPVDTAVRLPNYTAGAKNWILVSNPHQYDGQKTVVEPDDYHATTNDVGWIDVD